MVIKKLTNLYVSLIQQKRCQDIPGGSVAKCVVLGTEVDDLMSSGVDLLHICLIIITFLIKLEKCNTNHETTLFTTNGIPLPGAQFLDLKGKKNLLKRL